MAFLVRFWGVRGSYPVPGPNTLVFGGNTACVEVSAGGRLLILDAGTGICSLGLRLARTGKPVTADIFISHAHWDHIQGFPFFAPAFVPGNSFIVYGQGQTDSSFSYLIKGQMMHPHFPVSLDQMEAGIEFREVESGQLIDLGGGVKVRTGRANHPNGCLSYRIDFAGRSCCYITDNEHYAEVDTGLKELARDADVVIYDAHFTDKEYAGENARSSRAGWGHSTWREGIKLVQEAGARKLILFHHAPERTDKEMEAIENEARRVYADTVAAREGMVLKL